MRDNAKPLLLCVVSGLQMCWPAKKPAEVYRAATQHEGECRRRGFAMLMLTTTLRCVLFSSWTEEEEEKKDVRRTWEEEKASAESEKEGAASLPHTIYNSHADMPALLGEKEARSHQRERERALLVAWTDGIWVSFLSYTSFIAIVQQLFLLLTEGTSRRTGCSAPTDHAPVALP